VSAETPCPLCGPRHTALLHEVKARDLAFRIRMAQAKMRAAERERHEATAAKLDQIVNARTRKRHEIAVAKRTEAIQRYAAGDTVKNIAADLRRSERWVYEVIPENMKQRRKFT
jgi:DNA-binding NarL/FixJ family response regulator